MQVIALINFGLNFSCSFMSKAKSHRRICHFFHFRPERIRHEHTEFLGKIAMYAKNRKKYPTFLTLLINYQNKKFPTLWSFQNILTLLPPNNNFGKIHIFLYVPEPLTNFKSPTSWKLQKEEKKSRVLTNVSFCNHKNSTSLFGKFQ